MTNERFVPDTTQVWLEGPRVPSYFLSEKKIEVDFKYYLSFFYNLFIYLRYGYFSETSNAIWCEQRKL